MWHFKVGSLTVFAVADFMLTYLYLSNVLGIAGLEVEVLRQAVIATDMK